MSKDTSIEDMLNGKTEQPTKFKTGNPGRPGINHNTSISKEKGMFGKDLANKGRQEQLLSDEKSVLLERLKRVNEKLTGFKEE